MKADAIIVLGAGMNAPPVAQRRIEKAFELYKQGIATRIMLCGGCSAPKKQPSVSEAAGMKRYALSIGVPEEALFLEEESRETIGNALYAKIQFLEKNNWTSVVIVTSEYHSKRALYIFQRVLGEGYHCVAIPVMTSVLTIGEKIHTILSYRLTQCAFLFLGNGNTKKVRNFLSLLTILSKKEAISKNS